MPPNATPTCSGCPYATTYSGKPACSVDAVSCEQHVLAAQCPMRRYGVVGWRADTAPVPLSLSRMIHGVATGESVTDLGAEYQITRVVWGGGTDAVAFQGGDDAAMAAPFELLNTGESIAGAADVTVPRPCRYVRATGVAAASWIGEKVVEGE